MSPLRHAQPTEKLSQVPASALTFSFECTPARVAAQDKQVVSRPLPLRPLGLPIKRYSYSIFGFSATLPWAALDGQSSAGPSLFGPKRPEKALPWPLFEVVRRRNSGGVHEIRIIIVVAAQPAAGQPATLPHT